MLVAISAPSAAGRRDQVSLPEFVGVGEALKASFGGKLGPARPGQPV